MNQRQALCEASWNPIPLSRKGSDTNTKFKSTAKALPSSYATRRPQELRFRGTTPWRSALPGRARSAVRATALLRGCHRKTGASPKLHQETKRHSPRRQGFRRDPAVRPSKLRAGADSRGRPKDGTGPLPLLRLCEVADALTVGLKALHPLQPLECPTPRGDTGTKGSLPGAGCPQSPPARAQNVRGRGAAARRVRTQRPTLHSPVRSPQRGGARAVGSCGAPHASSRTPTCLGRSRRRQLGHEPSPRALPRGREGSTHSAREEGGNAGPTVCRQGRAPTSLCLRATRSGYRAGDSYRCSRWGCRYHRLPPGNTSQPDAVIGRAAAALGLWSRQAPSHSRTRPGPAPCWRARSRPLPVT
ncbi:uncharacterized protein LOC133247146 [Bos javanicus]|uniref:uncharacterized protein LOC133247146 n=1 Tax=Bos javanicus TaxID=9906 RepID=UPI002AA5F506|nr:uncharacterized protein LOC133247146 [Bos javanicus]XP_061271560.1 uncharacterized protein LOC133247146 [Bos javanicus]XP_061271561.1 uncharacterized protein LOC133247146 [Bos javanicus]XP_061271562.1 uncharacterized protein LOC133247146 [Bos javanicus]XP_061271563.1 uncharacterized protein LOC133247146 [Bos javanicus]XP_061271564.1 uncharacterized protein LOC133247146 [Bos javanicus]XP_061271565.1 uncharacterized protein LOC133247146 [Bos javanicus]XP_061271566.1 uncharacterized protein 